MKIGLYDIDSKIPNLALMKLSAWHKQQGDQTELFFPLMSKSYDKIYASQVFTKSHPVYRYDEIGGSGTKNWSIVLPDEIEHIYPDYELYNCNYAMGFTTRGCIRKCPFCIVKDKEECIKVYLYFIKLVRKILITPLSTISNATIPDKKKKELEKITDSYIAYHSEKSFKTDRFLKSL